MSNMKRKIKFRGKRIDDKQSMRTMIAGMAMQSLLSSPIWLNKLDNRVAEAKLLYPTIATMAVQQADALLRELNKETTN